MSDERPDWLELCCRIDHWQKISKDAEAAIARAEELRRLVAQEYTSLSNDITKAFGNEYNGRVYLQREGRVYVLAGGRGNAGTFEVGELAPI